MCVLVNDLAALKSFIEFSLQYIRIVFCLHYSNFTNKICLGLYIVDFMSEPGISIALPATSPRGSNELFSCYFNALNWATIASSSSIVQRSISSPIGIFEFRNITNSVGSKLFPRIFSRKYACFYYLVSIAFINYKL